MRRLQLEAGGTHNGFVKLGAPRRPAQCRPGSRSAYQIGPNRLNYRSPTGGGRDTRLAGSVPARHPRGTARLGRVYPAHGQKGLVARISAPTSNLCGRSLQSALVRAQSAAPVNWESLQRRRPLETYPNLMETTYGRGVPPRDGLRA